MTYDSSGEYLRCFEGICKANTELSAGLAVPNEADEYLYIKDHWLYRGTQRLLWTGSEFSGAAAVHGKTVALTNDRIDKMVVFDICWPSSSESVDSLLSRNRSNNSSEDLDELSDNDEDAVGDMPGSPGESLIFV